MTEQTEQTVGERMFHEVKTLEQGQSYILEKVEQVETARNKVDLLHAWPEPVPRETLEKAYRLLCIRYGQALGALVTLMHCRVLTDVTYNELRQRVEAAMLPKVVATAG